MGREWFGTMRWSLPHVCPAALLVASRAAAAQPPAGAAVSAQQVDAAYTAKIKEFLQDARI
jgi:hypothetical protein